MYTPEEGTGDLFRFFLLVKEEAKEEEVELKEFQVLAAWQV